MVPAASRSSCPKSRPFRGSFETCLPVSFSPPVAVSFVCEVPFAFNSPAIAGTFRTVNCPSSEISRSALSVSPAFKLMKPRPFAPTAPECTETRYRPLGRSEKEKPPCRLVIALNCKPLEASRNSITARREACLRFLAARLTMRPIGDSDPQEFAGPETAGKQQSKSVRFRGKPSGSLQVRKRRRFESCLKPGLSPHPEIQEVPEECFEPTASRVLGFPHHGDIPPEICRQCERA